ncbi:hypothetical protein MAE02_12250 [Microvirga aerophila]|uniref:Uncharacterized protein n=1 Tax=Microvirga aerophila TaxID=670291 RepID=A0A512BNJ7_9HYPH|nr:hypothetical protein MAE02_12250 [Microvirga aerophila]
MVAEFHAFCGGKDVYVRNFVIEATDRQIRTIVEHVDGYAIAPSIICMLVDDSAQPGGNLHGGPDLIDVLGHKEAILACRECLASTPAAI